jgi:type 1 glutamine amidotransferase
MGMLGAALAALGAAQPAARSAGPLRLLVVTGGHPYATSFYTIFEGYDDLRWDHAVSNHEAFRSDIRPGYDVLVLYDLSSEISDRERGNLRDFVESGKGVVVLHHAIADYNDWPWWYREVVGGRYVLKAEAGSPPSTYKEGVEISAEVVLQHPVTAGVGRLHLVDEVYGKMWISPDVKVLVKTNHPLSDGPVAWVSPYTKSRVVYIQLGHGPGAHRDPEYRKLVHNAILWTAGR